MESETKSGGYFGKIPEIKYEGPSSQNRFAFKYYNADEVILGKPMKDWLRFSVCYWHTWRGYGLDMFGPGTMTRPWDAATSSQSELEAAKHRLDVHFEFLQKLGVQYFCFHDRDVAPKGKTLKETNENLDTIVSLMKEKCKKTGIKVLWGTANLFSDPIYMNGAATNPDPTVFALAAAQVKKCLEVSHSLGAENYVFWGGREGYFTLLNTNMHLELSHLAKFLQMAVDYKKKIGFEGQFLIEPKPREPTSHQYDFDVATVIGFLKTFGLDQHFKVNIEANHATLSGHTFQHETQLASSFGFLGSLDANRGDELLGWDTDQFPMDIKSTTLIMKIIVQAGGLGKGGLNFDSKLRRESTDVEDLFLGHIGGMDSFARGLRNVEKMMKDGDRIGKMIEQRYAGWQGEIGKKIEENGVGFEDLEKWVEQEEAKNTNSKQWPEKISGKQELYEIVLNEYVH